MKISIKKTVFLLIVYAVAAHGLAQDKKTALLEKFEFQGREYALKANFSKPQVDIVLQGPADINLSSGMEGENIFLGSRTGRSNLYTFWINRCDSALRLAYYDLERDSSRLLVMSGFKFIALPEIVENGDALRGLVFLGNRSNNDDLFYYDLEKDRLSQLTATPFSEKGFTLSETDGRLEIGTSSLSAWYRYRLDSERAELTLQETGIFPQPRQRTAAAMTPAYYNTFIGFGDSITWGKIEGVQNLAACFLTQMEEMLADPDSANYYGACDSINLGVPGNTTLDGAKRVAQNLNLYQGFYFLLMLGVNDIINISFSNDSSLENLAFIIDTAKANGMRVIASTLTPSQDSFSNYDYYWDNLYDLSAGIRSLAEEKGVACIDPLTAFMNTDPPNGYKTLLERIIPGVSNGNHPNPEGHRVIAGLFADALVAFAPLPPSGVTVLNPKDSFKKNVQWDANHESDFSHFAIEFDFEPPPLLQRLTTSENHFTFTLFPFLPKLYFRLQTVDRGGRTSAWSEVFSGQSAGSNALNARPVAR
jgi:lysophospholipase L1-like esterase